MDHERRRAPRYHLVAEAEIVEILSNAKLAAKSSDVSLVGCFMNAASSLPVGTDIRIQLKRRGVTFTSLGVIARAHPMGMGVSFSKTQKDQEELLQKWLGEVKGGAVN